MTDVFARPVPAGTQNPVDVWLMPAAAETALRNALPKTTIKTVNGLAIASIKTMNGLT